MTVPSYPLARVRDFNFADQHVAPGCQGTEIEQVARSLVGLHSARLPTPYVTLASRFRGFLPPMLRKRQYETRTLVKLRCMRRTLHTVPLDLAPIVHRATLELRMMDLQARLRALGATNKAFEKAVARVRDVVAGGPGPATTIVESALPSASPSKSPAALLLIRLALKYLWERGEVTYRNRAAHWACEERWFEATSAAYPSLRLNDLDEHDARRALVLTYVDRFGPVTERDIVWWSGLRVSDIRLAVQELGDQIVPIRVDALSDSCLMTREGLARLERAPAGRRPWVRFLAYEDPSLKGYFETRARYLDPAHTPLAFNSIGEVLPCVMVAGELVGRWWWNATTRAVGWAPFVPGAGPTAAIERERVRQERTLRGW
jgi:hypothetical protein